MQETIILFLIIILSTGLSVYNFKSTHLILTPHTLIKQILLLCVVLPFIEESVFRHTLRYYLEGISYSNYINAVLFGLVHATNYIIIENKLLICYQVFATIYLGYYLIQFESLTHSFLVHSLYNIIILVSSCLIYKKFYNNMDINENFSVKYCSSILYHTHTQDDISIGKSNKVIHKDGNKFTPRKDINPEILKRIDQLNDIMDNKYFKNSNFKSDTDDNICKISDMKINLKGLDKRCKISDMKLENLDGRGTSDVINST